MKVKDLMEATQAARTAVTANRILEETLRELALEAFRRGETSGDIVADYLFCNPERNESYLMELAFLVLDLRRLKGRHVLIVHHSKLEDVMQNPTRLLHEEYSAALGFLTDDRLKFDPDSSFGLLSLPVFWKDFPDFGSGEARTQGFTIHPIHLVVLEERRYHLTCLKHPLKRLTVKDGKIEPDQQCELTLILGNRAIDEFCRNPGDLAPWIPDEASRRAWILEQAILLQEALPDDLK